MMEVITKTSATAGSFMKRGKTKNCLDLCPRRRIAFKSYWPCWIRSSLSVRSFKPQKRSLDSHHKVFESRTGMKNNLCISQKFYDWKRSQDMLTKPGAQAAVLPVGYGTNFCGGKVAHHHLQGHSSGPRSHTVQFLLDSSNDDAPWPSIHVHSANGTSRRMLEFLVDSREIIPELRSLLFFLRARNLRIWSPRSARMTTIWCRASLYPHCVDSVLSAEHG